jgi:hypothetical protein
MVIRRAGDVIDFVVWLIDVGWIHRGGIGRPEQAAERIGELLPESGQSSADLRQCAE